MPIQVEEEAIEHISHHSSNATRPRMSPLILCVDDTPRVLEGEKLLLEEGGYRVLTVTNAVQAFRSHSVDLLIHILWTWSFRITTDGWRAAALRLNVSDPEVSIICYPMNENVAAGDLEAIDCFSSKSEPVTSFLEKVGDLLSHVEPKRDWMKPTRARGISRINLVKGRQSWQGCPDNIFRHL
jgi:hypothetical protein